MPKLQRAKTVACGLLRWDRCCIIVVSHWSKPAGQNMASLLVVVGFRTSHSMPKEESHVIFSKNLPLKESAAEAGRENLYIINGLQKTSPLKQSWGGSLRMSCCTLCTTGRGHIAARAGAAGRGRTTLP